VIEASVKMSIYNMAKLGCPFVCPHCKRFRFKYRAIRDVVLIWPMPLPPTFVEGGAIVRPESSINADDELYGRSDYGLVLSVGPGYYDNKKFHPTHTLEVGMKVVYDKLVPWKVYVEGCDGKEELVVICGFKDVRGVVEEEDEGKG
jgi:hypothetical protein